MEWFVLADSPIGQTSGLGILLLFLSPLLLVCFAFAVLLLVMRLTQFVVDMKARKSAPSVPAFVAPARHESDLP